MSDAVLVAILGFCSSGIGSLLGVLASAHITQYRLEQLEKKVNAHNNLIDRIYKLESQSNIHEEKIKVANHRIEDLEKGKAHER